MFLNLPRPIPQPTLSGSWCLRRMECWHPRTSLRLKSRDTCLNWLRGDLFSALHMDNLTHSELRWVFCGCRTFQAENKSLTKEFVNRWTAFLWRQFIQFCLPDSAGWSSWWRWRWPAQCVSIQMKSSSRCLLSGRRWNDAVSVTSTDEASYSESGHILWEIPASWHPLVTRLHNTRISVGVNGLLEEPLYAEERGYLVEDDNNTVRISIPYNAEGGHRRVWTPERPKVQMTFEIAVCARLNLTLTASLQSLALGELVEVYVFELYLEQVTTDDDNVTTRLRVHKTLESPLLQHPLLFENSESNNCCWFLFQAKVVSPHCPVKWMRSLLQMCE